MPCYITGNHTAASILKMECKCLNGECPSLLVLRASHLLYRTGSYVLASPEEQNPGTCSPEVKLDCIFLTVESPQPSLVQGDSKLKIKATGHVRTQVLDFQLLF